MNTKQAVITGSSILMACALGAATTSAQAAEVVERHVVHEDVGTTGETAPNQALITSGVVLLGATYASSLVVAAATSDYEPDRKLYIPVAGPWLDLGERKGECGRGDAPSCDNEDLYQVLLVADGIGQGIGALQILGGFVFPVHHTTVTTTEARWVLTPRVSPNMMGVSALGTF